MVRHIIGENKNLLKDAEAIKSLYRNVSETPIIYT